MTRPAAFPAAGLTFLAATIILVPATVVGQSYRSVTDARLVSPRARELAFIPGKLQRVGIQPARPDRRVQRAESHPGVGVLDKHDRRPRIPTRRQ